MHHDRAIRVFDAVVAATALVVLAPLLAAIAAAIRLESPGPVFFRQARLGRHGHVFRIWKFRTMVDGAERIGPGLIVSERDERITRVGRWLRDWSLDELPQLINVLRGEMSLVGPRPAVVAYRDRFDARQRRRLDVPPGITGLAQVSGRNALSWEEKIEYDLAYVERRSLGLNLRILARTFPVLITREGLYGPPENFSMLTGNRPRTTRADAASRDPGLGAAKPRTFIVGAGGHGRVILDVLRAAGLADGVCFVDDEPSRWGTEVDGAAVAGPRSVLRHGDRVYLGVGDNIARWRLAHDLAARGCRFPTLVSPTATVSPRARIDDGAVVLHRAVVQAGARIERFAVINTGAIVEHDGIVREAAQLAPGVSTGGNVTIGRGALVGIGAAVNRGVAVGAWSLISPGMSVIHDVPEGVVYKVDARDVVVEVNRRLGELDPTGADARGADGTASATATASASTAAASGAGRAGDDAAHAVEAVASLHSAPLS